MSSSPRSYTFRPYDLLNINFLYLKGILSLCQQLLQQTSIVLELIAASLLERGFSQTPGRGAPMPSPHLHTIKVLFLPYLTLGR